MEEIKYKGYIISPNLTGWVNYEFHRIDCEIISGYGASIEQCKEQIDELLDL